MHQAIFRHVVPASTFQGRVIIRTPFHLEQLKVKWRSDYYATLESGRGNYMPKYGLMHLLACFTLFDDEPQLVNRILEGFLAVTPEQVHSVAKKYLRNEKRAIVFRAPAKIGSPADAGVREAA